MEVKCTTLALQLWTDLKQGKCNYHAFNKNIMTLAAVLCRINIPICS